MPFDRNTRAASASRYEVLRLQREKLRLSLEDLEQRTKISRRFLGAIERGAFEELPGGVFNISYLRQFARAVGCDEEQLVRIYRSEFEEPVDVERKPVSGSNGKVHGFLRLFSF